MPYYIFISALCIILLVLLYNCHVHKSRPRIGHDRSIAPEVYCIGENKYRYAGAYDICKQLGGRLATYDELTEAYKAGADWCIIGWCQDQKAYYVSQNSTDACIKGVIGGSMPAQLPLGAVCYGLKPDIITGKKYNILAWNGKKWSR